jgi:polysaccharide biosynthesis transport protein
LGNKPKCILIASALPREGKTLTGLFLARVAAMNGMRVLLIDADLRRSGLAKKMPIAARGLSNILIGSATFEDVVHQDAASLIHIIGCGAPVANPAGLLISERMGPLLERVVSLYDLVLIDTSAIMAGPDAMVLSHLARETLIFVRWAQTPRQVVGAAIQRLIDGGANVSGAIMTRVDLERIASYSMTDGCSYSKAIRRYYYPASRT